MTATQRAELIARYQEGYEQVAQALQGISEEELDFRPAPGKWTSREIVHHLADSEMIAAFRLRKLLVEENCQIQAYDQELFAQRLHYATRPIAPALAALQAARATTSQLLELMREEDWGRMGHHPETGPYSPEIWLRIYAAHAHNHADQIRRNRALWREQRGA